MITSNVTPVLFLIKHMRLLTSDIPAVMDIRTTRALKSCNAPSCIYVLLPTDYVDYTDYANHALQ